MERARNSKEKAIDRRGPANSVVICSGGRIMAGRGDGRVQGRKGVSMFDTGASPAQCL